MVSDKKLQEQIAKVLGWANLQWFHHPNEGPEKLDLVGFKKNGKKKFPF